MDVSRPVRPLRVARTPAEGGQRVRITVGNSAGWRTGRGQSLLLELDEASGFEVVAGDEVDSEDDPELSLDAGLEAFF